MDKEDRMTFQDCLENRKIIKGNFASDTSLLELEASEYDLKSAKESIEKKNYKWATVQGYYAMFRAARALLFSKGYREKSHNCCIIALKELFEEKLGNKLIEHLEAAKILREKADYGSSFSEFGAKDVLENAEEFTKKAREILEKEL